MQRMFRAREGEIGETVTWFVATVIIIVIILVSVLATSVLSKANELKKLNFDSYKDSYSLESTILAYFLTVASDGNTIYSNFAGEFDSFSGSFAVEVLKERIYSEKYSVVWAGADTFYNSYFGKKIAGSDGEAEIKLKGGENFKLQVKK